MPQMILSRRIQMSLNNVACLESLERIWTKSTVIVCPFDSTTFVSFLVRIYIGCNTNDCQKAWTIGYDDRFGNKTRYQQALMYYRPHIDDCQYAFPLDFCPIVNTETKKVIHIDVPTRVLLLICLYGQLKNLGSAIICKVCICITLLHKEKQNKKQYLTK